MKRARNFGPTKGSKDGKDINNSKDVPHLTSVAWLIRQQPEGVKDTSGAAPTRR